MLFNESEYLCKFVTNLLWNLFLFSRLMVIILLLFKKITDLVKNVVLEVGLVFIFWSTLFGSRNYGMRSVTYGVVNWVHSFWFHATLNYSWLFFHLWFLYELGTLKRSNFLIPLFDFAHLPFGFSHRIYFYLDRLYHIDFVYTLRTKRRYTFNFISALALFRKKFFSYFLDFLYFGFLFLFYRFDEFSVKAWRVVWGRLTAFELIFTKILVWSELWFRYWVLRWILMTITLWLSLRYGMRSAKTLATWNR